MSTSGHARSRFDYCPGVVKLVWKGFFAPERGEGRLPYKRIPERCRDTVLWTCLKFFPLRSTNSETKLKIGIFSARYPKSFRESFRYGHFEAETLRGPNTAFSPLKDSTCTPFLFIWDSSLGGILHEKERKTTVSQTRVRVPAFCKVTLEFILLVFSLFVQLHHCSIQLKSSLKYLIILNYTR